MMRVARELGYNPVFFGAYRDANLPAQDSWEGFEIQRVGKFFPLVNGTRLGTYALGILHYSSDAYRRLRRLRPAVVHASDVECGIVALLYCRLNGVPLLYNIHDNLAQRYPLPGAFRWLLNVVEGTIARFADVTMVPEGFRRDALPRWSQKKVAVVRNTPEDPGATPRARRPGDPIRIFFGGWLDRGRGLQALTEIVASQPGFELVVAGEGSSDTIEWLRAQKQVQYIGFVPHAKIIEQTKACDIVAALYDPKRIINVFAASNKIAEALAVGRPVLVNAEAKIAGYLREQNCGVIVPYSAVASAGPSIKALVDDPESYARACQAARDAYERDYHYDVIREKMIRAFQGQLKEEA
jgi:glycosyltransferase involved in cell wall biosynthesis